MRHVGRARNVEMNTKFWSENMKDREYMDSLVVDGN
jgi:hypothetical protein